MTRSVRVKYEPWANVDKGVGQAYVHISKARFRVLMAGRQSGKTRTGIAEICSDALAHPGHIDWWVTQSYKTKDPVWRALLDFLPKEVIAKKHEGELRLRLTNGSEIFVKSADAEDSLVSESLDFLVCDEAGLWKQTAWDRGLGPMLTARPHARVLFLGTPRSRNWFYKTWLKGWQKDKCFSCARGACETHDPEYDSFTWRSEDSPFADLAYLAERKRNMPADLYREEYEADPLDSSGGVFHNVRNCIGPAVGEDRFTCIGVDIGQKHDFTAIIPMNSSRQALWVERTQEEFPLQRQRLAGLCLQYGARLVMDSAVIGLQMVQELRSQGLPVEDVATNSNQAKRSLIDNLRIAFQNGTIRIPNDEVLINELEAYTYEVTPTGMIRYSAPEGEHDDTVIALALALWGQRGAMARSSLGGARRRQTYMKRAV